jgi:hypothetical protein
MSVTEFSRRGLLKTAALGVAGATLNLGAGMPGELSMAK